MTASTLIKGFNKAIRDAGIPIRIRYLSQTIGSVWDDEVVLSQSGADVWTSGVVLSLSNLNNSDNLLMEQGKLNNSDKRLYVGGNLLINGSSLQVKIQIGSATTGCENYSLIPEGVIVHEAEGQTIYKKVFIRRLTGSLLGE